MLPEVFTDRQTDGHARVPQYQRSFARNEVAALVEYSVIRQVMLDVAAHHPSAVKDRSGIDRGASGTAGDTEVSGVEMIEIAHDADQVTKTVRDQVSGQLMQAGHRGVLE